MKISLKNKWTYLTVFSIISIAISCEETNETYDQFTKDGETVYIGAPDTVLVAPGFGKLRFSVVINADPKISKGVVQTKDMSIMHEFDVTRQNIGKDTVQFDIELEEGEYNFDVFLKDDGGNTSVSREVPSVVYADNYLSTLISRQVKEVVAYGDRAIIEWSDVADRILNTTITYEDASGTMQTVTIPNDESETELDSFKLGGEITVISSFTPVDNAIETFDSAPITAEIPNFLLLDPALITALKLPFDATDGCYGGSYEKLTDGATGEFWHSCEGEADTLDQYPFVMSFDLGVTARLTGFRLDERSGCCGERSPASYQIWGTNDLGGGDTADIDSATIADWEADAIAKGWVKLLEVSDNTQPTFEVDISGTTESFRYVRVVAISSIEDGAVANFDEFTFMATAIE